ncbi:hypothetical protein GWK91_14395 [Virgibacillus sp. MSP4-1]|uniref:Lin0512 family protein n=1 Tax=Virgibacillus sp. MSP4-1 TaxID=2700081 RepID=UPI0003A5035E|nr:Lin0512 family protein [Virgibacillus sp. MSP4-1]QHS24031.1 hypothetical protein GWK91_14395 [Virgibacillus sp. MSP4-1]
MKKLLFIETGMGIDVHGQNVTKAAVRAVHNAIHFNSMPGIKELLPDQNLESMQVKIKLGVPSNQEQLDEEAVKAEIPYGQVTLEVQHGGLATTHGIVLEDKDDQNDLMLITVASVEVGY